MTEAASPPSKACVWPLWGNQDKPSHCYCGKPREAGRVYCEEHVGKAYVRGLPRSVSNPDRPAVGRSFV